MRIPTICAALVLTGCTSIADMPNNQVGMAELRFANGLPAGNVQLLRTSEQLSVSVDVTGMTPGAHGFHLHTTGRCDGPDFTTAGGHLNPGDNSHGTMSAGGSHLGDLPNLQVGSRGTASADLVVSRQAGSALSDIFDADGTAVIVHANADDYRTDPSGNAGARIACGVLRAT